MEVERININTGHASPRVYVSDLHILDGSHAEDFDAKAFAKLLLTIPDDWGLTVLGDCLELWQARSPWNIIKAHRGLLTELFQRAEIVAGNHDWKLAQTGLSPAYGVRGRIHYEHGHLGDPANRRPGCIGRAIAWTAGWIERLVWRDVDVETERALKRLGRLRGRDTTIPQYFDHAEQALRSTRSRIYLFGHTHKPGLFQHGAMVLANCGDWVGSSTSIIVQPDAIILNRGPIVQ